MVKFSELSAKEVEKLYNDKVKENLDKNYPRSVALKMADEYVFRLWAREQYNESDCESYEHL